MPEDGLWERLVNAKWPGDMPVPTEQEAIAGAKRLYRKAMGKPFTGKVRITSGNRHTWVRRGVLCVNPSYRWRPGWQGIVHSISHYAHSRLHPNDRPHADRQAYIERDLTDYAIESGFHTGSLKRTEKPKQKSVVKYRYRRILARQAQWEAKLKRAQNAVRKVSKERRDYERRHGERLAE